MKVATIFSSTYSELCEHRARRYPKVKEFSDTEPTIAKGFNSVPSLGIEELVHPIMRSLTKGFYYEIHRSSQESITPLTAAHACGIIHSSDQENK
jgi:hypothetical protein